MQERIEPEIRPARWKQGLWLVGMVLAFFVVTTIAGLIAHKLHLSLLLTASVGQLAILLVPLAFSLVDGGGFRRLGLFTRWKGYDFAVIPGVIAIHFAGSMLTALIMMLLKQVEPNQVGAMTVFQEFGKLSFGQFAAVGGLLALQAGLGEELLFRGYLITRLERLGLGAVGCVVISALIFGLVHVQGYGWLPAMSKGIFFGIPTGLYFWHRRNLGPLIVSHALMDFLGFLALYGVLKFTNGHLPGM